METSSIINFIKTTYPKVVFTPFKFQYNKAVAFIISGGKLIIGFINKNGNLCKLIEPIDLEKVTGKSLNDIINKIPIVSGFTDNDKTKLLNLFESSPNINTISKKDHEKLISDLKSQFKQQLDAKDLDYKTLYDSRSNKMLSIKKEYDDKISKIVEEYKTSISNLENSARKIMLEKDGIVNNFNKYKTDMDSFIKTKDLKIDELEKVYKKISDEKQIINNKLNSIIQNEKQKLSELQNRDKTIEDYTNKIAIKESQIKQLESNIDDIKVELDKVQEEFSKSQLKNKFLEGFKSKCQEKIINEKEQIIEKIKQYNQKWMNWSENIEDKFDEYKRRLISELQIIQNNFTKILDKRKLERSEYNKLKQNIAEVESELKKTISDQIIALNEKDEQIKLLQSTGSGFLLTNKGEVKEFDTTEELNKLVTEKDRLIEETRKQQEEEITKLRQEKDEEIRLLKIKNTELEKQQISQQESGLNTDELQRLKQENSEVISQLKKEKDELVSNLQAKNDELERKIKTLSETPQVQQIPGISIEEVERIKQENLKNLENIKQEKQQTLFELERIKDERNNEITSLKVQNEELEKQLQQQKAKPDISVEELERLKQENIEQINTLRNEKEQEVLRIQSEYQDKINKILFDKNEEIKQLSKELEEVKQLIDKNNSVKIEKVVDYNNCLDILQKFSILNNVFFRKQEIINKLDEIINQSQSSFQNLNEQTKNNIKTRYDVVKSEIIKHINFLDLPKYINSPNFNLLKNKSTQSQVPPDFCSDLVNILEYWKANETIYREQDRQLTNIYEDLSGAVRVYIRIKPLPKSESATNTLTLYSPNNKKTKSIILDCSNVPNAKVQKNTYGEFYGVFEDAYSNLDVYTGIQNTIGTPGSAKVDIDNILESADSVSPGLYSTFQQVEDGYSIVIFGYGLSGSGKTYTLLGSKGREYGLLHYGLANLKNVSNIKLKYLFEQYISSFNITLNKMSGKIHNLIRQVPKLEYVSVNENQQFLKQLPSNLNLDNIKIEDLYILTDALEKYRTELNRIKKTPNNPQSSRSHLYLVFEITFNTGKVGYVTIVDTAGRESPIDIYKTFFNTQKVSIPTLLSPSTRPDKIPNDFLSPTLEGGYTPIHAYNVLKEGFYINETINHIVYFFNKKNYKEMQCKVQTTNPTDYNVSRCYIKPFKEEQEIDNTNNCLMIPIMNFLDSLSNKNKQDTDYKPTKFIMMCMVRQEQRYCDQIAETLEFAGNVKSS